MNYLVALPPELGLSADEFVVSWNEVPECSAVAQANLTRNSDANLVAVETVQLNNVAENINNLILEQLVRQAFYAQGVIRNIAVLQQKQSDNVLLLVVQSADE